MITERERKLNFIFDQVSLRFDKIKEENKKIVAYSYQFLYWMILLILAEITYLTQLISHDDNKGAFCLFLVAVIHIFVVFKYLIPLIDIKSSPLPGEESEFFLDEPVFTLSYERLIGERINNYQSYIVKAKSINFELAKLFKNAIYITFVPLAIVLIGYFIYFIPYLYAL